MSKWFTLKVKDIEAETEETKTVELEVPKDEVHNFDFKPGQFIGLKLEVEGEEEERSYSLSSSEPEEGIKITVKKVDGGKVSSHIVEKLACGDSLYCTPPEGRFTINARADARRKHYFMAAGSGITPVYSMIKYLLEAEPKSEIHLLYGNRKPEETIFLDKLEHLQELYEGQFFIRYVYSQGTKSPWNIFRIDDSQPWSGRIDPRKVKKWLKKNPKNDRESHYYICGPGTMNQDIYQYLQDLKINSDNIHVESFRTPEELKEEGTTMESTWKLEAQLNGNIHSFEVMGNKPILEVLLEEGVDAPHSCTSGACASCLAKIEEGSVEMDVDFALTEDEKEQGYILTCQSRPKSGHIKVNYDV